VFVIVLVAEPILGQTKSFDDHADVVEVQVPVNVYTRAGAPVRDLTADMFEIYDAGKRQAITDFQVVDLEILQPQPGEDPADAVPAMARRHFLLLFDLSFANTAAVIKAREAAQEFVLNHLHATDLTAVATYSSETGPRLVVTFTPDRAQLARAIQTLGAPRLLDGLRVDPLRFVLATPENSQSAAISNRDLGDNTVGQLGIDREAALSSYLSVINKQFDRIETTYQRGRVSSWAAGLKELARVLASVQGRKHVVLFSEGFDGRLMFGRGPDANDAKAQLDQLQLQYGNYGMVDTDDIYGNGSLQKDIDVMLEEFRRADCVIQAVDISGLSAEFSDERRASQVGQDALFYIANETGGSLYEDANGFAGQLVKVLEKTSVTYVLHFRPETLETDGTYHRLKVKLRDRKGVRLAHRSGYYAPKPFEDLHPLEKSLLAADAIAAAAPVKEIRLNVLAAPFRATNEHAYVPVVVEVDGASLLIGHESRRKRLPVELYTYVTNEDGEMRDFFTQLVTIELDSARAALEESGMKYYGHLDLEPGNYLVRVLVRNAVTGRTGVETVRVEVPQYHMAEPDLLPPFFLEPPDRRWVMVRERRSERDAYEKSVVYPFTVNGSPYVPSARPLLADGKDADLCLVAYNMPAGEITVAGMVLGADGAEIKTAQLEVVERTVTGIRGLDKLLATFQPTDLAAGDYTLRVGVEDTASGMTQFNTIPFTIVN
jgi:VWFA-related protein